MILQIAIGIFVGTEIVKRVSKLFFNDLILKEKAKRKDKIESYNQAVRKMKDEAIKNQKAAKKRKEDLYNQYEEKLNNKAKIFDEEALKAQSEMHRYIMKTGYNLRDKMKKIDEEMQEQISKVIKMHKESQLTSIRNKALNIIRKELIKSKEKNTAYIKYLQYYLYFADQKYKNNEVLPEHFEYSLPDGFPYKGKIYYKKVKELNAHMTWTVCKSTGLKKKFHLRDFKNLKYFSEDASIPLFVEKYDFNNDNYLLSIAKGLFMENAVNKPGESLTAEVKEIKRSEFILDYYDFDLILKRAKLINGRRIPPLNSTVHVYPYNWNYHLTKAPYMSERKEDGLNQNNFDSIPFIIDEDDFSKLKKELNEKDLWSTEFEWKIAPIDSSNLKDLKQLKCSVGGLPFTAEIMQEKKEVYLKFKQLIDNNEQNIKHNDVFVVINATFEIAFTKDKDLFNKKNFEKATHLLLFLNQRFEEQKNIISSRSGIKYFDKWSKLTNEIVEEGFKGKSFYCEFENISVRRIDERSQLFFSVADIVNKEELARQITKFRNDSDYKLQFFTFNHNKEKIIVEFGNEVNAVMFYHKEPKLPFKNNIALIYKEEFPYPEIQQKKALNQFREGILVNNKLKINMLNPKTITKEELAKKFDNPVNKLIDKNDSQLAAVKDSFKDKNIFMIQGPPGTGKTTVIKELILQELKHDLSHKILVTSQANVAVDNVITKLLDDDAYKEFLSKESIIRYGKQAKIDDSILFTAYEKKEDDYFKLINDEASKNDDFLTQKWNSYISKDNDSYSNIGELFLKNHQVVAATCIGLAQKKAGLDKVDFDLVIIDEAGKTLAGELIIPILRAKKVIIIGDHKQLPPMVNPEVSEELEIENRYDDILKHSIFERLFDKSKENKIMLDTQYRMPNIVGDLISQEFYNGNLKNGKPTFNKKPVFSTSNLNMINMDGVKGYSDDSQKGESPYNLKEVEVVSNLLEKIDQNSKEEIKVAIITPYLGQKNKLIKATRNRNYDKIYVDINTIDAFQGNEADLVIFATTRSKRTTNFFRDNARLNVALSRVIKELWVIGSLKYFKSYSQKSAIYNIGKYLEDNADIFKAKK